MPQKPRDRAWLMSEKFAGLGTTRCVKFWYHMYGADIGHLRVRIFDPTQQTNRMVFDLVGDQGNNWQSGQTSFSSSDDYNVSKMILISISQDFTIFKQSLIK